jgi:hypothetical protein
MTAGGRRTGPRSKKRWGQTLPLLPPGPPPEGIDLVIGKLRADDEIVRSRADVEQEQRAMDTEVETFAAEVAWVSKPERDQHGRIVVDRTHALIGAVVVAIVAAGLVGLVIMMLNTPPSTT